MNSIDSGNVTMKMIEFHKYLNCPDCRASGLYCPQHRIEVEKILEQAVDLDKRPKYSKQILRL